MTILRVMNKMTMKMLMLTILKMNIKTITNTRILLRTINNKILLKYQTTITTVLMNMMNMFISMSLKWRPNQSWVLMMRIILET